MLEQALICDIPHEFADRKNLYLQDREFAEKVARDTSLALF
jgi:hypothetical protein